MGGGVSDQSWTYEYCISPESQVTVQDSPPETHDKMCQVSGLVCGRQFLLFAFKGQAYQFNVLTCGLSLSPRIFTKVTEAALTPLREVGICSLNNLDDCIILANSRELLCGQWDTVLQHLA